MRSPKEIAEKCVAVGVSKAESKISRVFILSVFAGMFIAFAGAASTFAGSIVNKFCAAIIFCGGLSMVVVAGSELFTGNNLLMAALLKKKITIKQLLKNWVVVYIGNFIGSVLISLLVVYSDSLSSVYESAVATAVSKVSLAFLPALFKGILCNILVCIAVWMSFSSDNTAEKIILVIFPVSIFVLCGFEHSIANMYFIPTGILAAGKYGVSAAGLNLFGLFIKNLLPVTIGNIIGGSAVVGTGYYCAYLKE